MEHDGAAIGARPDEGKERGHGGDELGPERAIGREL